ncbi:MAG: hypothetical protein KAJ47_03895, partial [Candidatus Aenigmarchaeota archaeon]|nr:hypothetical protein [Candidatus Aenigmarchaeota archaeon]
MRFYCSDNPSVPFAINNYSSIGADSEIEIESNGSWVAKSGTYNLSAVVSVSDDRMSGDGEATLENNDIFLEIVIEDFTLNSSVIDFGTLNVGSSLLRSVSLSNTGLVNQKNVIESVSYWKYFNQTETFTKLENKTYYFTRPQNVSYNDLDVGLTYNTSRGTVRSYIDPFTSGSSGFSRLVLEVIEMESSPLYVEAYVKMPISVLSDMNSSFPTSSVTIYNLSSEMYNYDFVLPSGLGYGTFGGNVTYSNANDSASFNTSFVSNAAELLIRTNYSDVPVLSENGSLTFYADPDWNMTTYELQFIKNNGPAPISGLIVDFFDLNFTKSSSKISYTTGSFAPNSTLCDLTTSCEIPITVNVSGLGLGTYTSRIKVSSLNAEPYDTQYVTLNLVVARELLLNISKNASLVNSDDTVSLNLNVVDLNKDGVVGLSEENVTDVKLRMGSSYVDVDSYNLSGVGNGDYELNVTLPDGIVGGNFALEVTIASVRNGHSYIGRTSFGMSVREQYLDAGYVAGYYPVDIDLEDGEYAVYYVNITNTGLANSSVPITARLTSSCTTADLVIYSSTQ